MSDFLLAAPHPVSLNASTMVVFLNGQFVTEEQAVIPVSDRGFMYGDGLFETMRVRNGKPFRMAQHLDRMVRGAEFLGIKPQFTPKQLENFAEQIIAQNNMPESILRVTLTRGPGQRGYSPKDADKPTIVMTLHSAPPLDPDNPMQWALITSSTRIPVSDVLSSFKTTSKLMNIMVREEAEDKGADEAMLVNSNGEVAETAGGNLFWVYREKICTTPEGRGILPGITRAVVLEICQVLGLETTKCVIKPEALLDSDAIFITQSAFGIVVVNSLDGEPVAQSPLVKQIHSAYCEMLAKE